MHDTFNKVHYYKYVDITIDEKLIWNILYGYYNFQSCIYYS